MQSEFDSKDLFSCQLRGVAWRLRLSRNDPTQTFNKGHGEEHAKRKRELVFAHFPFLILVFENFILGNDYNR
jgi:hypothetical protein